MSDEIRVTARPRARIDDSVRVVSAALFGVLRAALRRLAGRRRRQGWSVGLELLVSAYRGTWSVMPTIGIARWDSVGETLTPLKFDGLTPQVVRHDGPHGAVRGVWLEPPGMTDAVLLYFHGGGFCFASLRTHGPLIGALARSSRARTFGLEYRLAPEHPAPAAIEDALAAYRYLLAQGIPAARIVVAGDSAGGTMVLNTLLALRDGNEPLPVAGIAISPWVDLGCSGNSFATNAPFDFVGEEHCRLAAASYLAGADGRRPDMSPLFADLSGLPPLLIHAGAAEVLVDQIRAFTARAEAAAVDVRLDVYDDMVHVWHLMRSATPDAQRAIDDIGAFVQEQVKRRSDTRIVTPPRHSPRRFLVIGDEPPIPDPSWEEVLAAVGQITPQAFVALGNTDGTHIRADGSRFMYTIAFHETAQSAPFVVGRRGGGKCRGKATLQDDRILVSTLEYWSHDGADVFKAFYDGVDLTARWVLRDPRTEYAPDEIRDFIRGR